MRASAEHRACHDVDEGLRIEPQLADLRPGELQDSCLDPSLAARELGWRAEVGLDEGLRRTYEALVQEFAPQA